MKRYAFIVAICFLIGIASASTSTFPFNATAAGIDASAPFFDMLYVEPNTAGTTTALRIQYYGDLARFAMNVIRPRPFHISIGLQTASATVDCCNLSDGSAILTFFKEIGTGYSGLRVTLHPVDGWANPKWPFVYAGLTGLDALKKYYSDLTAKLTQKGYFQPSGLVFGESMGGSPMQNTPEDVAKVRSAIGSNIFIGASPGGVSTMNEWYTQIYDWEMYADSPWVKYRGNPSSLFDTLKANSKQRMIDNHWLSRDNQWFFLSKDQVAQQVWMFAWDVPGDTTRQPRLEGWTLAQMFEFCRYTKQSGVTKTALYLGFSTPNFQEAMQSQEAFFHLNNH